MCVCVVCVQLCVIPTCTVFLVFGQLKPGTALARHSPFPRSLSADVGAAVVLVHAVHPVCAGDRDGQGINHFITLTTRDQLLSVCVEFTHKNQEVHLTFSHTDILMYNVLTGGHIEQFKMTGFCLQPCAYLALGHT